MVHLDAIGPGDVVGDAAEVVGVATLGQIHRDNPLEPVSGGAAEEQLRLEVVVLQEGFEQFLNIGDVVEVQAEEAAVVDELVFAADGEGAGEGAIVEAAGFELAGAADVPYLA